MKNSLRTQPVEAGTMFLELALVLPFLLITVFCAFEAISYIRTEQALSNVSREVARAAFDCMHANLTNVQMNTCVDNAIESVVPRAAATVPIGLSAPNIQAQVWQFTAAGSAAALVGGAARGSNPPQIDGATISTLRSYSAEKRRLLSVEAYSDEALSIRYFSSANYALTVL